MQDEMRFTTASLEPGNEDKPLVEKQPIHSKVEFFGYAFKTWETAPFVSNLKEATLEQQVDLLITAVRVNSEKYALERGELKERIKQLEDLSNGLTKKMYRLKKKVKEAIDETGDEVSH